MTERLLRILYWASFVFGIFMAASFFFTADVNPELGVGLDIVLLFLIADFMMFTPYLLVVVANYIFRGQWAFFPWHVR